MTEINNSADWRAKASEHKDLINSVLEKINENAAITVQHKIFGTALPPRYICKMIFLTLLEQAFANKYSGGSVNQDAFTTPKEVCDAMYKVYNRDNINTNKSALAKKNRTNRLLYHLEDSSIALTEFEFTTGATIKRSTFRIKIKFNYTPERKIVHADLFCSIIKELSEAVEKSGKYCNEEQIKQLNEIGSSAEKPDAIETQEDLVNCLKLFERYFSAIAETAAPDELLSEIGGLLMTFARGIEFENAMAIADVRGDEVKVVADSDKSDDKTMTVSCLMKVAEFDDAFTKYVTKAIYTRETFGENDTDSEYSKLVKKLNSVKNEIADTVEKIKNETDVATKEMLEIKHNELKKVRDGLEEEIRKVEGIDENQPSPINNSDITIIDGIDKQSVMQKLDNDITELENEMTDAWNRFKHKRLLNRKKQQRVKVVGVKLAPPMFSIKESKKSEGFKKYSDESSSTTHLLIIVIVILVVMCLAIFAIYNLIMSRERRHVGYFKPQ